MIFKSKKGFTLIELLVVVAIIGILSSIVLASLSTARNKGQDASAKGSLSSARAAAELYFDEYGDYGTPGATTQTFDSTSNTAPTSNALAASNSICEYTSIVNLGLAASGQAHSPVICNTTEQPAGYTIYVELNDAKTYCVDSAGYAGYITGGSPVVPYAVGVSCLIQ